MEEKIEHIAEETGAQNVAPDAPAEGEVAKDEAGKTIPETGAGEDEGKGAGHRDATSPREARTFTQAEADAFVARRVADIYRSLGVTSKKELEDRLEGFRSKNEELTAENAKLRARTAMDEAGIVASRRDDVETWFRGKGETITPEALEKHLATHPEWKASPVGGIPVGNATAPNPGGAYVSPTPKSVEAPVAPAFQATQPSIPTNVGTPFPSQPSAGEEDAEVENAVARALGLADGFKKITRA